MGHYVRDAWDVGEPYEQYVGRWSRNVAREFIPWLAVAPGETWGDVGSGTGALVANMLAGAAPRAVLACDRSAGFLAVARRTLADPRVRFFVADAGALPWENGACAATVSGLVLNFVPDAAAMVREMARVTRPGGIVAAYVWDYERGMEMMRHFWDAAVAVDPAAAALDEGLRFPLCRPDPLRAVFQSAGLRAVVVRPIVIPTVFSSFDVYWAPFLGKQGPAPNYLASVNPETREQIRTLLKARLAPSADGAIRLTARAWAVQGVV